MKNHYKIIGVDPNASTEQIREIIKKRVMQVKKSNFSYDKKKKSLKSLENSYKALTDYHTRKQLDEYLNNKNKLDVFYNPFPNIDNMIGNMEKNFFTDLSAKRSLENLPKNTNSKYYYHTSYTSSKLDENGNRIVEKKHVTNADGKVDGKHTITTKDKAGNNIVKELPLKFKKYIK